MTQGKPALWTPGDWNAFFGFGTNILVNMLVLTGLAAHEDASHRALRADAQAWGASLDLGDRRVG